MCVRVPHTVLTMRIMYVQLHSYRTYDANNELVKGLTGCVGKSCGYVQYLAGTHHHIYDGLG